MGHLADSGASEATLPPQVRAALLEAARQFGTPSYVYLVDRMLQRFDEVRDAFDGRFVISYAVKSNPNAELMRRFVEKIDSFDCSSIGEVERALAIGYPASRLTFSGPAKRMAELRRAVEAGVGEMVCESESEIEDLDRLAGEAGRTVPFFIRINPGRAPKHFGVNMAGKPSQFGVDEEDLAGVLSGLGKRRNVRLEGFHIYSGTNSLHAEAIAENFGIFIDLFTRFSREADLRPRKLIFGSGFGIPYHFDQAALDLADLASRVNPMIDEMRKDERLSRAVCVLEMGRYLVGREGYLVTSVVREKRSRGTEVRLCDAGFNNHLAACGMMGTVIRRNWRIWKISGEGNEPEDEYHLTGPLCTTIDQIATRLRLPRLERGDVVAVGCSGAYGLTASPTRFISHPEPREVAVVDSAGKATMIDCTDLGEPPRVAPDRA